ncbi:MAG: helix-turn-helix domain-containing protein [Pseudomonadota bacterium]
MILAEDIPTFHLPSLLAERAKSGQGVPKRRRTRLSLLAATAAVMEEAGYGGLTIEAVVARAGVARGTFYLYFANRGDAALAVMRAFRATMRGLRPRGGGRFPAEVSIYRMNLFYVRSYARNASILIGGELLLRDRPDLARRRDFDNQRWAKAVLRDLCWRSGTPDSLLQDPGALLAVRAIIGMADELLRETFVHRSASLGQMVENEEQLAEALSFVWYRAIFGRQPEGLRPLLPVIQQLAPSTKQQAKARLRSLAAG